VNIPEYGIIYIGDMMKNYKVTNRGKILSIAYFIVMIGSYFFNSIIFYSLSGLLLVILGIEIANYLGSIKNREGKRKEIAKKDNVTVEEKSEELEADIKDIGKKKEETEEKKNIESISENDASEEAFDVNNKEDYKNMVDDFDSIEEDIQSMEKDLEAIGKKSTDLQKASIESYYQEKKSIIASNLEIKKAEPVKEAFQSFEEESLLDSILEKVKTFFSFKRYKKGNLVLHKHFGIGKIIDTEETLKVSFINDQLEEIIEFEYDKQNKIPELDLFKAPKGEDERQYYYNYKRDVSDELLNIIEKINLNFPDIKYQWNVFLKSGNTFEKYDFIAISDRVHVFSKGSKDTIQSQPLEELLKNFELEIKIHEISDYTSINSILLKSKIKGVVPFEVMDAVNEMIEESNIKDFNERMLYLKN